MVIFVLTTIKGSCIVCPCSPWEREILHLDEMVTNTVYSCDTQSSHVSRHGTRSCKATVQDHDYIACISYKTQFNNRLQTWTGAAVASQFANSWLPRTCMPGLRGEGGVHDVGGGILLAFHDRHQHDAPSQQATDLHVVHMSPCEAVNIGSCGVPASAFVVSTSTHSCLVRGIARCTTWVLLAIADSTVSG